MKVSEQIRARIAEYVTDADMYGVIDGARDQLEWALELVEAQEREQELPKVVQFAHIPNDGEVPPPWAMTFLLSNGQVWTRAFGEWSMSMPPPPCRQPHYVTPPEAAGGES